MSISYVLGLYEDYNTLKKDKEKKEYLKLIKTEFGENIYLELMEIIDLFKK